MFPIASNALQGNWLLLKNSLLVSGLTTLLAVSLGLIGAVFVAGLPRRCRDGVVACAIAVLALPPFLVVNAWLHFFGPTGVWRQLLPINIVSLGGAAFILGLLLWPIAFLMIRSAWQRLEPHQLESDMAVRGWHLLWRILLPLVGPALALSAAVSFVLALNNFAVPAILQVKTYPAEVWIRFSTSFDPAGTLKMSWPLVIAPLLLLCGATQRIAPWPHIEDTVSPELFRRQFGSVAHRFCGVVTVVLLACSLALPLLQVVFTKRTWTELPGALAAGEAAVWNSFFLAVVAAAVAILVTALALLGGKVRGKGLSSGGLGLLGGLCWLPFLVPGVLLGIGLITVFNRPWSAWFYQSAGIVVFAFSVRYFVLGLAPVANAARQMDPDLADVARLEGADWWQMLRHVYLPQLGPQFAAGWYIVFLLCLWDVESIILIMPPQIGETLALRIFNLLHYGHNAQVNALCLTLVFLAVLPLILWRCAGFLFRCGNLIRGGRTKGRPSRVVLLGLLTGAALIAGSCGPRNPSDSALRSEIFSDVKVIGRRGVGVGELNKPRSVAVDRNDNLYVVDMTGRVQKFSSNGVFLLSWQMPQTDLGKPKGMCRDQQGNIVVVEPHYSRVNHFSPEGRLLFQWGDRGTNEGQLSVPRAVAINSRDEVFVTEYLDRERVQKFLFGGGFLATNRSPGWVSSMGKAGTAPGEFNRPEGICVDANDKVYVADSCNHRIQVFSSDGKLLRVYGKPGKGKGELSYPYDICVDPAGRQYVCEFGNSRVQVFDANGQSIEIIGGRGAELGRFGNPWGVALDSAGNLYVADSQNHRVQKFIKRPEPSRQAAQKGLPFGASR
jgi:ABC-type Fe3+ transport system permease subunit/DNA-binding beta-propeller fold protein YncE